MPAAHGAAGCAAIAAGPTHVPPARIHRGVPGEVDGDGMGAGTGDDSMFDWVGAGVRLEHAIANIADMMAATAR